jgi:hypothetical protein
MDTKELIKWGAFIILGWLALRWLSNLAGTLAGGFGAAGNGPGWNAPYAAPLTSPYVVQPWNPPWRGRYGPGKRYGGPGPY